MLVHRGWWQGPRLGRRCLHVFVGVPDSPLLTEEGTGFVKMVGEAHSVGLVYDGWGN